jgi:transcriptional regulator with XRE-family HTH domain
LDIHQAFGLAVRKLRLQKGWSQEKFAEIASIHRTYVSSIELGKVVISLEIAQKIATAFDLTLSQLIKTSEMFQQANQKTKLL